MLVPGAMGEPAPASLVAAEVSLSVARLTLLQSALDLLKTCPEGFLDGQALGNQLRELHPEHVAEVTGYNPKGKKGWTRQLLSQEPLISQVVVPGRSDVCYTLGSIPGALPAGNAGNSGASHSFGLGFGNTGHEIRAKRPAPAMLSGLPDAKRRRGAPEDLGTMADRIPEATKVELVSATVQALHAVAQQQGYLEGNKISETLKFQLPGSVDVAKAAVGGKGWLRAILETVPDFIRVDVAGKAEPCYCLADSVPDGSATSFPAATPPPMPRMAAPRPRPFAPRPHMMSSPALLHTQGQVAQPAITPLAPWQRQVLVEAALSALATAEKGFLEGNRLSDALRIVHPDLVVQAKFSLGGKEGKGWLKKFLEPESSISQVEVDSVKEPCYCLAGQAGAAGDFAAQAAAAVPQVSMEPAFPFMAPPMMASQPMMAPPMMALQMAAPAPRPRAPAPRRPAPPPAPAISQAEMDSAVSLLLEAAVGKLGSVPDFLEGNKLSEALKTVHPALVDQTRAALGGKGWLKKMLEQDARICSVKVQGLCEPCYALAERCAGGITEFVRDQAAGRAAAAAAAGGLGPPRAKAPTGEDVLEKISGEEAAELYTSAFAILQASGAGQGGYLEGSRLAEKMKAVKPQLVDNAKALLRKGWLKAVLELEPRIQAVEVEGRNEPCYCILST